MEANLRVLSASTRLPEFARDSLTDTSVSDFLVEEQGKIVVIVTKDAALKVLEDAGSQLELKDVMQRSYVTVTEERTFI